jgi:hypothetical protein
MAVSESANRLIGKRDLIHLAILLATATGIGVYLIATTVLIGRDGTFYVGLARKLSTSPVSVIRSHPVGYPFLIFAAHRVVAFFGDGSSLHTWMYSAQCISLLCRVLALVPLYFVGRMLVGSRHSFWGLLILVFLPYPAKFGSNTLRDWPHMLFLSCGFLVLLWAARERKWKVFFLVGLLSGLGYLIRPVCAQLLVYGIIWLSYCLLQPAGTISRKRAVAALILLLVGFLIPAGPDMKTKGAVAPRRVRQLIDTSPSGEQPVRSEERDVPRDKGSGVCMAGPSAGFVKALYEIYRGLGENLMWVFVVPWLVGLFYYFRPAQTGKEKHLMPAFIGLNLVFLVLRSTSVDAGLSKRHILPLICFTCFYISTGLDTLIWKIAGNRPSGIASVRGKRILFCVLVVMGLGVCSTKLFLPLGIDKHNYRNAAKWLRENTPERALIAVPDKRISFYAERTGLAYEQDVSQYARYVVRILKAKEEIPIEEQVPEAKRVFSIAGDDKESGVVIYDFENCISEKVSFVGYDCEKIGDEKYRLSLIFRVKNGFEQDWVIYFHGAVSDENIILLPEKSRQYGYANWDFRPRPATSAWPKNQSITITRDISAKPIPYDFNLGFYTSQAGHHGREINIGWVDLGDIEQGSGR